MLNEARIRTARTIDLSFALDILGLRWSLDRSYRPRSNPDSRLVLVEDKYELTVTGPLFVLRRRGSRKLLNQGRGAIDLAMALTGCGFRSAVLRLTEEIAAETPHV